MDSQIVALFVGWGVLCIFLTFFEVMNIANVAHFSGLAFGGLVGLAVAAPRGRRLAGAAAALLVGVAVVPLFWAPWSVRWVSHRAYTAHVDERWREAAAGYQRAVEMGAEPGWALYNLCLVYNALGDEKRFEATLKELKEHAPAEARKLVDNNQGG